MLHLAARLRGLGAGPGGYAAIVALAGLTWAAAGPEPFASDAGFVQRAAAVLFALAGAAAYRLPSIGLSARALLATAGAWLAVDEWTMVHEALKFGPLARLGPLRDAPVLLYGVGAGFVAITVAWRVRPPLGAVLHASAAALAVLAVLLLDVAGLWRGPAREALEETAELLAAWGAIRFCAVAARDRPAGPWREALVVEGWSVVWLGAVVWLLKPIFAPARFL